METIHVKLPRKQLREVDEMVRERHYPSRSELVREAIRRMTEEKLSSYALEKIKRGMEDIRNGRTRPLEEVL